MLSHMLKKVFKLNFSLCGILYSPVPIFFLVEFRLGFFLQKILIFDMEPYSFERYEIVHMNLTK
jgi:hypothetical protein